MVRVVTRRLGLVPWLLCAIHVLLQINGSWGAAQFQLRLSRYSSDGTDAEGQCCGGACPGSCRTFFRCCLTHYGPRDVPVAAQHHMRRMDVNTPCSFGLFVSDVVGNNSMQAEVEHNFTFDLPWPGKFKLIVEAWHTQNGTVPLEGSFRREARRPLINKFRSLGASEWFLDLATRVLDIPERWIQRRVSVDDRAHRLPEGSLVRRFSLKRPLDVGPTWTHWGFGGDAAKLDVDFRVVCAQGFTGANCSDECPAPDAVGARFRCLANGSKECLEGWTEPECDVPACADGCHPEHGFCERPGECLCKMGWEGARCERCTPMPGCLHGACNASFECNCLPGWDGFFCNRPMCGDGCHPTRGYCEKPGQCSCRFGWQGEKCDRCKPLPGCLHGRCSKPLECLCDDGWTGIFCHIPVCSSKCHYEHGYCAKPNECRCRVGWMGEQCDQCCPYPGCRHGTCTKPWECHCQPGWGGSLCDKELKFCEDHSPCSEGSTCVNKAEEDGFYQCLCPDKLAGRNCTVPVRRNKFLSEHAIFGTTSFRNKFF